MSKVDQVKAEYAKKLIEAECEDALAAKVPAGYRSIHLHSSYGTVGSVSYGDLRAYNKSVTPARAVELVQQLPPVAMTLVHDGCTSFRPTVYVEALPEEKKARWGEEVSISPVRVQIEALHGPKVSLEWTADIAGVGLVQVTVHLGELWPLKIGMYEAKKIEFRGGFKYEPARFSPAPELHVIRDDSGQSIAQLESPIRWASGGPEYPNNMTLYFVDLGADLAPEDVGIAIVQHLAALATAPAIRTTATT